MKIKTNVKFMQEGGAVEAPAPAQQGGEDPIMALAQMAAQALQNNDGQLALQVCQGFLQLVQEMAGGAEQSAPQGEPVYRKGGKLAYKIND